MHKPKHGILIVDDSALNNALMAESVRGIADTEAFIFTSPLEAAAFVREQPDRIGVGIIDYDMPEMDGLSLIRSLREIRRFEHVPLVMLTSIDQRRVRRDALEAGATDFMGKPFDAYEIRARIGNLLALNQARRSQQDRAAWLAQEVAAALLEVKAREREIVTRLSRAAEHRDTDTGDHVLRVGRSAKLIAEGLGCPADWCDQLELAALMHDIGKIGVPDAVLLKQGSLTPQERAVIMRHTEDGHRILQDSSSEVIRLAAEVAISHHERWDGQGYPRGLHGTEIPLSGRIVAVADVFDALCSERPYKRPWSAADANSYLANNAGSQFDPDCVRAFLAAVDTEDLASDGSVATGRAAAE